MRRASICVFVVATAAAPATADPVRWQAPDGTTMTLEVVDTKLRCSHGDESVGKLETVDIDLPKMTAGTAVTFRALDDDVVVASTTAPGMAWRFSWRRGVLVRTGQSTWKSLGKRPKWVTGATKPTPISTFARFAELMRLGAKTGFDELFDPKREILIRQHTRGQAVAERRTATGAKLIEKWLIVGYPIVRGTPKLGGLRCVVLPSNKPDRPAAPNAPPDTAHLYKVCFDKDLKVESVELVVSAP
jgi:hypothetical protein